MLKYIQRRLVTTFGHLSTNHNNIMKRTISFSVIIGLFIVLGAMTSYVQLGQLNFTGSASNGYTCANCHGTNDSSLSISYWLPNGTCYEAGSTFQFVVQLRDSSQVGTRAGIQLATVSKGSNGYPDPVTLCILGSSTGFFQTTIVDSIEIHTSELPHWLGFGITYPSQTQGYGANYTHQYWTHINAVDTIHQYVCAVVTVPDSTNANDRVICGVLHIPNCKTLALPTDSIYLKEKELEDVWEPYRSDFTLWGQEGKSGLAPFEIYKHKYNHQTKKIVKIH